MRGGDPGRAELLGGLLAVAAVGDEQQLVAVDEQQGRPSR